MNDEPSHANPSRESLDDLLRRVEVAAEWLVEHAEQEARWKTVKVYGDEVAGVQIRSVYADAIARFATSTVDLLRALQSQSDPRPKE
jgi:hypothetical protein